MAKGLGYAEPSTGVWIYGEDDRVQSEDGTNSFSELLNKGTRSMIAAIKSVQGAGTGFLVGEDTRQSPAVMEFDASTLAEGEPWKEASGALQAWLNDLAARGVQKATIYGKFHIKNRLNVPWSIRRIKLAEGALVQVERAVLAGDTDAAQKPDPAYQPGGFYKRGGTPVYACELTASVPKNVARLPVPDASIFKVGETLIVTSLNPINTTSGNFPGWMRYVIGVNLDANTITVNQAIPRTIDIHPMIYKVDLAPSFYLEGPGQLLGVGRVMPRKNEGAMLSFYSVWQPSWGGGVEIGNHSTTLVAVNTTIGGTGTLSDLHDAYGPLDGGYGVTWNGPVFGHYVDGSCVISRVRHAHTTNAGSKLFNPFGVATGNAQGEPETCWGGGRAVDTGNTAYDTHRLGWDIHFDCKSSGAGGSGVQCRADKVSITGVLYDGAGTGVSVQSYVTVPANIHDLVIDRLHNPGGDGGLNIQGPAIINNVTLSNIQDMWAARLGSDLYVQNLQLHDTKSGIRYMGTNTVVEATMDGAIERRYAEDKPGNNVLRLNKSRVWAAADGPAGYFYERPRLTSVATGSATIGNYVTYSHEVEQSGVCEALEINVTTPAAGAYARVGLRASTPDGKMGKLLYEADARIDLGQAGARSVTVHAVPANALDSTGKVILVNGQPWPDSNVGVPIPAGCVVFIDVRFEGNTGASVTVGATGIQRPVSLTQADMYQSAGYGAAARRTGLSAAGGALTADFAPITDVPGTVPLIWLKMRQPYAYVGPNVVSSDDIE
jgi:hypothetical protein